MVFFTCNSCGQSIKKQAVEKHYLQQCRNCESVSCIDCGKDFWGDSYKEHIKCITEAEKVSGKDYKPKPSSNKGEEKQNLWTEQVHSVAEKTSADAKLTSLLDNLCNYPNIPRKRKKFENFLKNSLNYYDTSLITRAWDLLEKEIFSSKSEQVAVKTESILKDDDKTAHQTHESEQQGLESKTDSIEQQSTGKKKKNKKKSKEGSVDEHEHNDIANDESSSVTSKLSDSAVPHEQNIVSQTRQSETGNVDEPNAMQISQPKEKTKKKKKKRKADNSDDAADKQELTNGTGPAVEHVNDPNDANNVKPLKKHSKHTVSNQDTNGVGTTEQLPVGKQNKKKKKTEHQSGSEILTLNGHSVRTDCETDLIKDSSKTKKRNNSVDTNDEVVSFKKQKIAEIDGDQEDSLGKKKTFKFIGAMKTVLKQAPNQTLRIKKLRKKVLAICATSEEYKMLSRESLLEKFTAKLTSSPKFTVEDKMVKLTQ